MTAATLAGISVELDAEGFLVDPSTWTEELAAELARESGIPELTPRHWQVVNYIRTLQGRGGAPADTSRVAAPGETGDKLPGATRLAPTVPSHFRVQPPAGAPTDTARRDSTTTRTDTTRRGSSGGAL